MPSFKFSRRANWPCRDKILSPPPPASEARKLFVLETNYPSRRIIRLRRTTRLYYKFGTKDELWSKIRLRLIRLLARLEDELTEG